MRTRGGRFFVLAILVAALGSTASAHAATVHGFGINTWPGAPNIVMDVRVKSLPPGYEPLLNGPRVEPLDAVVTAVPDEVTVSAAPPTFVWEEPADPTDEFCRNSRLLVEVRCVGPGLLQQVRIHGSELADRIQTVGAHPALFSIEVYALGGDDRINARNGSDRDIVHCGAGRDVVFADAGDLIDGDCEQRQLG